MDDESRRILALQKRLEQETDAARLKQRELEAQLAQATAKEEALIVRLEEVEEEKRNVLSGRTDDFLAELRAKERGLEAVFRKAQELASNANIPKFDRERALEGIKKDVRDMRIDTETAQIGAVAESTSIAAPLEPGVPLEEGASLVVLEKGAIFGSRGVVVKRNKGRGRVHLRVAGVEVKMERHLLGTPLAKAGALSAFGKGLLFGEKEKMEMSAKDRKLMQMMEDMVEPGALLKGRKGKGKAGVVLPPRTPGCTVDLRDCDSINKMQLLLKTRISRLLNQGGASGDLHFYAQHDQKEKSDIRAKLRIWLRDNPLVEHCTAVEGDSFTAVSLVNEYEMA